MKKIIYLILIILIFTGCSKSKETNIEGNSEEGRLSVVSTIFTSYDFVRQIGGDKVDTYMLLPVGSESHSYEPTPQDIIKIQDCDVFIYAGGESDSWVDEVLRSMDTSNMKIISMMDCVNTLDEEIVEGMEDDHDHEEEDHDHEEEDHDHEEVELDEHVWTSPKNAKLIVEKISSVLCELDPENAEYYKSNTEDYVTELDRLDRELTEAVENGVRNTIIFGDRFPFRYLAYDYGLDYYAAFPGCSTETEASAKTIAFLIDKVNEEQIPVVFHIELSNEKIANTIGEATGAKVMLLHSCHNVSKDDFESGIGYVELMERNVQALEEALN